VLLLWFENFLRNEVSNIQDLFLSERKDVAGWSIGVMEFPDNSSNQHIITSSNHHIIKSTNHHISKSTHQQIIKSTPPPKFK